MQDQPTQRNNYCQPKKIEDIKPSQIDGFDEVNDKNKNTRGNAPTGEQEKKDNSSKIIEPVNNENRWTVEHSLLLGSIIVNILLVGATFWLVYISNATFNVMKTSSSDATNANNRLAASSEKSAQAALKSADYAEKYFAEYRNEFKLENQGGVQFDAVITDYPQFAVMLCRIENMSKPTIHLIKLRWSYSIQDKPPSFRKLVDFAPPKDIGFPIKGGDNTIFLTDTSLFGGTYELAKKGVLYIGGYVKYRNETTKEIKKYAFEMKFYNGLKEKKDILHIQDYKGAD